MPTRVLKPVLGIERPSNYEIPAAVRRDFPQELRYEVELRLKGRRVLCRCGEALWSMFRDNEEFVCECRRCGSEVTFGMLCFTLFDVSKLDAPNVVDVVDVAVLEDGVMSEE